MNGKYGCNEGTGPTSASQLPERQKEEDRRRRMQQDVCQMMSPRLETEKLTIQHVRNRGKRMPVVRMHMSEGPLNPVEGEAVCDPWILVNVLIVVVIDKLVPEGLAEDDPDNSHKKNTDNAGDERLAGSARNVAFNCGAQSVTAPSVMRTAPSAARGTVPSCEKLPAR